MLDLLIRTTSKAVLGITFGVAMALPAMLTSPANAQASDMYGTSMPVESSMPASESILVTIDHAKILRLDTEASTVILGNPAIADAAVFDSSMIVLTGKSFGTTNLIILDAEGQTVRSAKLTVRAGDDRMVTVQRGAIRESYECAPNCQPSLIIGDAKERFETLNTQIKARTESAQDD
ncbi:MAG: pilus assembly protein N-terminal domain-containing protein [Pseudomonadota bacterium]